MAPVFVDYQDLCNVDFNGRLCHCLRVYGTSERQTYRAVGYRWILELNNRLYSAVLSAEIARRPERPSSDRCDLYLDDWFVGAIRVNCKCVMTVACFNSVNRFIVSVRYE